MKNLSKLWQDFNLGDKALMVLNFFLHPWKLFFLRYKNISKALDIGDRKRLEFQRDIDKIDWQKYYITYGSITLDVHGSRVNLISATQRDKIG
jgi:hypothetical protein